MSESMLDPEQQEGVVDEPHDEAVRKAATLANALLEMPERFGASNGDENFVQQSLDAMKGVLDYGEQTFSRHFRESEGALI